MGLQREAESEEDAHYEQGVVMVAKKYAGGAALIIRPATCATVMADIERYANHEGRRWSMCSDRNDMPLDGRAWGAFLSSTSQPWHIEFLQMKMAQVVGENRSTRGRGGVDRGAIIAFVSTSEKPAQEVLEKMPVVYALCREKHIHLDLEE